ncbi:MAG: adenylate/guanylate cyclase domain-containing protein [Rhizobiaceae bacterium]|nr:adenylate/guanylate cyclase domain-containing protein [Rhizobiaceae bacterium]
MKRQRPKGKRELWSGILGALVAGCVAVLVWLVPASLTQGIRQPAIDFISNLSAPPETDRVAVVDITAENLDSFGGRNLSRQRLAELIGEITRLGASVIALDLVLGEPCDNAQAGTTELVQSIADARLTMGFLLSGSLSGAPPVHSPVAIDSKAQIPAIWSSVGAETSCAGFVEAAAGLSAMSLAGDFDARVRSVPAFVLVDNRAYPSLGLDAVRLAQNTGGIFLIGNPPQLRVGGLMARLDGAAGMHARFSTLEQMERRTIAALDILNGQVEPEQLSGKIVFLGSSAPELGGLRPVSNDPLRPSVQIHADVAANLLLGSAPILAHWSGAFSLLTAVAFGISLSFIAVTVRPLAAFGITMAGLFLWFSFCAIAYHRLNMIVDPFLPALTLVIGAMAGSAFQFSAVRRAEAVIRNRFEQRLPAKVVAQLVAEPDLLKLKGEQREATSLFTDIEGFSTTAETINPSELIGLLDGYFEGLTGIIITRGGMVDRTIGDGIHALFNAPVDLENHAQAALACAQDILEFTENFRHLPTVAPYDLGRTRIGIETGNVVLGDVGASGKVDYTAFGSAINIASRLQDANKRMGTSILIGEKASSYIKNVDLVDLGAIEIRGIGMMHAFTTKP